MAAAALGVPSIEYSSLLAGQPARNGRQRSQPGLAGRGQGWRLWGRCQGQEEEEPAAACQREQGQFLPCDLFAFCKPWLLCTSALPLSRRCILDTSETPIAGRGLSVPKSMIPCSLITPALIAIPVSMITHLFSCGTGGLLSVAQSSLRTWVMVTLRPWSPSENKLGSMLQHRKCVDTWSSSGVGYISFKVAVFSSCPLATTVSAARLSCP